MLEYSGLIRFRIDPALASDLRRSLELVLGNFKEAQVEELGPPQGSAEQRLVVDFLSENSPLLLEAGPSVKLCFLNRNQDLFSFGKNLDDSFADGILDDGVDLLQIENLLKHPLACLVSALERKISLTGLKNLRKFENKGRNLFLRADSLALAFNSTDLLQYAQALVDLEKDLIHCEDLHKQEKVLKHFVKQNLEKAKFQFYPPWKLFRVQVNGNLLLLPVHKGNFLACELSWDDDDQGKLLKKLFFYFTVIGFYRSGQTAPDPFFNEKLWESVLDSIPFPVALLSGKGEVCQHNTLFAKLGLALSDCLRLREREKILINDIPYNVFRKDLHHLDEDKFLFVFFTESFFLKGEGNLTPTGQELGIISSSIAHELNNPIAGIQAALTLLLLDEGLCEEATQTLVEMKNGSVRCKQLIETFLGFSSRSPRTLQTFGNDLTPVEVCYTQAQNLLRFRTVESGIRFTLESTRHGELRAPVNISLMTMTFYLLLGEVMTLYSHQLLVADKNQIEKVIRGEIIESSQEISLQLHELNISSLRLSKLIQNLLNIENFVLQVSEYSLRFIYNPPAKN
ncbi:MAG TPA: histidine kinase dimerization/phospho-acceptor domain-containing protein [Bacteriovoracaceae bacterium]|nr:histidine kinase dimerization/phospho-acceptor domain-containing protein [Bacteriovoracaceae bacterium]